MTRDKYAQTRITSSNPKTEGCNAFAMATVRKVAERLVKQAERDVSPWDVRSDVIGELHDCIAMLKGAIANLKE